jgi:hypothetical protein
MPHAIDMRITRIHSWGVKELHLVGVREGAGPKVL